MARLPTVRMCVALAWTLSPACAPEAPSPGANDDDGAAIDHRGAPVLAATPRWTVVDPAPPPGMCFGVAVAAGDLDGDGYRDVIVGEGACAVDPPPAGRIAIYRGGPGLPSTTPVWTQLDWQTPDSEERSLALAVGDVDGDGRDDLLVSSSKGAQVFAHLTELRAPLPLPVFRVPGAGAFGPAVLADVDGDGRADLVSVVNRVATVWRSTPHSTSGRFTATRVIGPATNVIAGDANGDGRADIVATNRVDSRLLLGCRLGGFGCDGGLRAAPSWSTTAQPVVGLVPDLNHDGMAEAFLVDTAFGTSVGAGRAWLYLSDRATGGLAAAPAWATLGDSHYVSFGSRVIVPGDLDGDHRANEFVVLSFGRAYAFFPQLRGLADMQPGFAWPRQDSTQAQLDAGEPIFADGMSIAAAGDIDRDGFADLLASERKLFDTSAPGRVHLFGGGRRPLQSTPPPFLPGEHVCNLPTSGKADITIDVPSLERSMYVERQTFAPDACEILEGCIAAPGERRLLLFGTSMANFGGSAAVIPGPDTAPELYHESACEDGGFELTDFAVYDLVDAAGGRVVAGGKQSIAMVDIAPNCSEAGPARLYGADFGLSPGWGDVYVASTPCNWLDTTGVPDGRYTLRIAVDTQHIIDQDDVLPDHAAIQLELAGDHVTILR